MFKIDEPHVKIEDETVTDASTLSEGSAPETMDLPETTELPANTNLPESMEMAESLSMEGSEMVEERLHDSLESQEAPDSQESQEEWLNEDVLTDDDFNPANETADSQASQTDNSQSEMSPLANDITEPEPAELEQIVPDIIQPEPTEPVQTDSISKEIESEAPEQNIEDALNTLEGGPEKEVELPDLDEFLIKKTYVKPEVTKAKTEPEEQEQDGGNDTDDLLRMLGEDGIKTKKLTKTVKDMRNAIKAECASSDDDDFVFKGASAKKLKLAKSLVKKVPIKAEPEDMDNGDTDGSSDEGSTMEKIFAAKSNSKTKQDIKAIPEQETQVKNIVSVREMPKRERVVTSTPLRQAPRSLLRSTRLPNTSCKPMQVKREQHPQTYAQRKAKPVVKTTASPSPSESTLKTSSILKPSIKQPPKEPEVIEEEQEEEFPGPEEEFESDFEDDVSKSRQRIMNPERMDEDVPSDAESHSEDGSLYDELPSSESEDADDWFQIDIRAEKAGDYLPLLGSKAKEILLEEKQRVGVRLANLKQSLGALTDSGKKQAEQVRTATMALAELDDMLKTS